MFIPFLAALAAQTVDPLARGALHFQPNAGLVAAEYDVIARAQDYALTLSRRRAELHVDSGLCEPTRISLVLVDALDGPAAELHEPQPTTFAHFHGARSHWISDVPSFASVRYDEVWPGVDVVYLGDEGSLRYDFVLAPHADPNSIRLRFDGARNVSIHADGALHIETDAGTLVQPTPLLHQDGQRIGGGYLRRSDGDIGFAVASYDPTRELIIDPTMSWLALLASENNDFAEAIARDSQGNLWVAGFTEGVLFPRAGAGTTSAPSGSVDAVVSKLDPTGTQLLFSAYIGGVSDDRIHGLAVDSNDRIIACGHTSSNDFPVQGSFGSSPPIQGTLSSGSDGFVFALSSSGALEFSTYLGSSGFDVANAVAIDVDDSIVLVGSTTGADFPTLNASQPAHGGGLDGFVARVRADGNALEMSTYFGGGASQEFFDVAVAPDGSILVGGRDATGPGQALVQSFSVGGAVLQRATFIQGAFSAVNAVAVMSNGDVVLAGVATDATLITVDPLPDDDEFEGEDDGFVVVMDATLTTTSFASYLGGPGEDSAVDVIARDGHAYVLLETRTVGLLLSAPMSNLALGFDGPYAFLVDIDFGFIPPSPAFASYLPLPGSYAPTSMAAEPTTGGALFVAGSASLDVSNVERPFDARAFGEANNETRCVFVTRIDPTSSVGTSRIGFGTTQIALDGDNIDIWVHRAGATDSVVIVDYEVTFDGVVSPNLSGQEVFGNGHQVQSIFLFFSNIPAGTQVGTIVLTQVTGDAVIEPGFASVELQFDATPTGVPPGDKHEPQCAIAYVSDGTPLMPHLDALRAFRDASLTRSAAGRGLIEWYYAEFSPRSIDLLRHRPYLLAPARLAALISIVVFGYPLQLALALCALVVSVKGFARSRKFAAALVARGSGALRAAQ